MGFAKKSLGQNFLKSKNILEAVRDCIDISPADTVLEVGPGEGDLTKVLLEKAGKVTAVEKDDRLIPILQSKFSTEILAGKLTLIHGDGLSFDISSILKANEATSYKPQATYKIAANIPYYITGQFIRKCLSGNIQPTDIALIIQKEVAERIVARGPHGEQTGGKESILSISVKVYGTPHYVRTVPRSFFTPAPNVDSAILSIRNISKKFFDTITEEEFFEVVKIGFSSKRKQLLGNLSALVPREKLEKIFQELSLDRRIRAEDVKLEQWKKITERLQ